MHKKNVLIKKILPSVIGEARASHYTEGLSFVYAGPEDIYDNAFSALMAGDTESCLKYMIFGLDVDKNYLPLLNLCRTTLFGMINILKESDAQEYIDKYSSIKSAKNALLKDLKDITSKQQETQEKIDELENKLEMLKPSFFSFNKFFIVYFFSKRKIDAQIKEYQFDIESGEKIVAKMEKEYKKVNRLALIDEYLQILQLIVEVCTIPGKYESLMP